MELLTGAKLGKYQIVGRLAAGGMAEVYLARLIGHAGFARPIALKRMLPDLAIEPGFREMFMQEAALAARLNHPHIVQIFDFAEQGGELYLAMEYVHGVNLRRLIHDAIATGQGDSSVRVPPLLAAHICRCIARALAYAWQVPDEQGRPLHLIHRDVSPHNVLLSYEGDIKLADFGIARPADRRTSVGMLKGKLLYMAPEQLAGGVLDARTDVFALGIVLYETARNLRAALFDATGDDAVKAAVVGRMVVPPERMDPDFPRRLSAVVMKALERDPDKRFQSAAEFADALGEAIHHESRSPQDCDLVAFMRRLYGAPPPVLGDRAPEAASAPSAAKQFPAGDARDEIERRADDPSAATLSRERAEALRAAPPADDPGTRNPRAHPPAPAEGPARRVERSATRRTLMLAGATFVAGSIAAGAAFVLRTSGRGQEPERQSPPSAALVENPRPAVIEAGARPSTSGTAVPGSAARVVPEPVVAVIPSAPAVMPQRTAGTGEPQTSSDSGRLPPPTASPAAPLPTPPPALALGVAALGEPPAPVEGPTSPVRTETAAPSTRTPTARPAASERPAAPPERRGPGTLVVHVKPWAFAWVDGEPFTGEGDQEAAPLLERTLSAGRHVVHLQDPLGRRRDIPVVIGAGRVTRVEGPFDGASVR